MMDNPGSNEPNRRFRRKSLFDPFVDDESSHFVALSYPTTRFIPYQDRLISFFVTLSLFNSFTFELFVRHRSYESLTLKYDNIKSLGSVSIQSDKSEKDERSILNVRDSNHEILRNVVTKASSNSRNNFKYYCFAVLTFQMIIVFKEALIVSLKYLPERSPYRVVDCFLLGRTIMTGTYTQVSQRIGLVVSGLHLLWIWYQLLYKPNVRFDCLEFLLHTSEQVEGKELEGSECCSPIFSGSIDHDDKYDCDKAPTNRRSNSVRCKIFQYIEPALKTASQMNPNARAHHIRTRKNRNLICWSILVKTTLRYFAICALIAVLGTMPIAFSGLSVWITRQGFELSYSTCVDYIRSLDSVGRQRFSFIYTPDDNNRSKPIGPVLDFTDIITFDTPYNISRLLADALQTSALMTIIFLSFISNTFISMLVKRDLENYIDPIEDELCLLVRSLRVARKARFKSAHLDSGLDARRISVRAYNRKTLDTKKSRLQLSKQISSVQTQLMDLWKMISHYSVYIKNLTFTVIGTWLVYSIAAAEYLLAPNGMIYYETIGGQIFTTVYFLVAIGQFATITRRIRGLYPLMASAMALDDDCIDSKSRWPMMLDHYHPKPMYSLKVFQFTISWNFCLQVS